MDPFHVLRCEPSRSFDPKSFISQNIWKLLGRKNSDKQTGFESFIKKLDEIYTFLESHVRVLEIKQVSIIMDRILSRELSRSPIMVTSPSVDICNIYKTFESVKLLKQLTFIFILYITVLLFFHYFYLCIFVIPQPSTFI